MKIETLQVGPLATNCYLLGDEQTGRCAIIDPGAQAARKILPALQEFGMQCDLILLTHGHFDHIMALKEIKEATGASICIHEADAHMLTEEYMHTWKAAAAHGYHQALADRLLKDGDQIQLGTLTIRVMHTPGHTRGSVVYLCGDVMFSGDTLFHGDCGAWLPCPATTGCCPAMRKPLPWKWSATSTATCSSRCNNANNFGKLPAGDCGA